VAKNAGKQKHDRDVARADAEGPMKMKSKRYERELRRLHGARDAMFAATDTAWAPWYVAHSDDKKRARLNVITHLLGQVPYAPPIQKKVELPKRTIHGATETRGVHGREIPTPF
jgi:hypothetical protein